MNKNEAMRLHTLLLQLYKRDEELGLANPDAFRAYDALDIQPTHIHRTKGDHIRAILNLCEALSEGSRSQHRLHFTRQPRRDRL